MRTPVLEAQRVAKAFEKDARSVIALDACELVIEEGAFVTVLGRSGCGKSTLLNLLAGLTRPTAGSIVYRGDRLTEPRIEIGYLTQQDTLMPWRTLRKNIELPLELRGVEREERGRRAVQLLDRVGLAGYERHYPRELSGGMRRRASLARLLIGDPDTLLLDEPFGALDAQLRSEMQAELLRLWHGSGKTVVFVTHDIEEALVLADRVVVLGRHGATRLVTEVPIARPRDIDEIRVHPVFVDLHRQLARALKEEADAVAAVG